MENHHEIPEDKEDIVEKISALLIDKLSEDDLMSFADLLDCGGSDLLLEALDKHLAIIRPDLFIGPTDLELETEV